MREHQGEVKRVIRSIKRVVACTNGSKGCTSCCAECCSKCCTKCCTAHCAAAAALCCLCCSAAALSCLPSSAAIAAAAATAAATAAAASTAAAAASAARLAAHTAVKWLGRTALRLDSLAAPAAQHIDAGDSCCWPAVLLGLSALAEPEPELLAPAERPCALSEQQESQPAVFIGTMT